MKNVHSTSTFLIHEGHVLLVLHKRFELWLPVGGELEDNERPLFGAIREVKEETGLELTLDNFPPSTVPGGAPGFLCYEEHPAGVKEGVERRHLNFAFYAHAPSRDIELCDEHSAFEWIPLAEAPNDAFITTPNVAWCLIEIRRQLRVWGWPQEDRFLPLVAEPWTGCGECDLLFECYGGQGRCARLPAEGS